MLPWPGFDVATDPARIAVPMFDKIRRDGPHAGNACRLSFSGFAKARARRFAEPKFLASSQGLAIGKLAFGRTHNHTCSDIFCGSVGRVFGTTSWRLQHHPSFARPSRIGWMSLSPL
jgi:hypothetical protein